jgi:acetyl-CoA carboxylase carboxyl transferase subunit beta
MAKQREEPEDERQEDQEASEAREGQEAEEGRGRLSRLRFSKKKDMPGGLWLKCERCAQMIYRKELEARARVCPACDFHFTLPGRERIEKIVDEGTWEERFAEIAPMDRLEFVDKVPYGEKLERTAERLGQKEALICGLGSIRGREVVLAVLDFSFLGGSMGEVVGEKIALAADLAASLGRSLVVFTSSGGARMHEGALSLMQMAKTCAAIHSFHDVGGFSVCVMTHPTTGGVTASFASICDITLAEPGALIGFAGPRVIATTLKQELPPGFQRAEFLLEKGMVDAIVVREGLRQALSRLIDYGSAARERREGGHDVGEVSPPVPRGEQGPGDRSGRERVFEVPDKFVPFDEDELQ